MTTEEWRPVAGFDKYFISDQGRVMSTKGRQGARILRPGVASNGYYTVAFYQDRKHTTRTVHSLVAEAFHGHCPAPGYEVRHLNGQKFDCRVENLRWGSPAENAADTVDHGHHYWANRTHCKNGHPWDDENTYQTPKQRVCRTCYREVKRRYLARKRAAAQAA